MQRKIKNIAIIGLGLIGGSLAKALKEKGYRIAGIDTNNQTLKFALREKIISNSYNKLTSKVLKNTDIVFICTPLHLISNYLKQISKLKLKRKILITDTGSTKTEICNYAKKVFSPCSLRLTACNSFIGGHPMAGTEKAGFMFSNKSLFKNRVWALTPTKNNKKTKSSIMGLKKIIERTGAKVIITTPEKHDKAVALISHFPLLAALSLCELLNHTKDKQIKNLALKLASSGFKDTVRLAAGNPEMNSNLIYFNFNEINKLFPLYFKVLKTLMQLARLSPIRLKKRLKAIQEFRGLFKFNGNRVSN